MRVLVPALVLCAAGATIAEPPTDGESIFASFYSTPLDTTTAYAVRDLPIRHDSMTILLKKGTVFLMQPIDGQVYGAAFIGDGEASMTPPNNTERYMLAKRYGKPVLKEPFTEAAFRFSDGTAEAIRAAGRPDPDGAALAGRASAFFGERNKWWDGLRALQLENSLIEIRLSGLKGLDFFLADMRTTGFDWLTYGFSPQSEHEHYLGSSETTDARTRRYLITWNSWHVSSDYGPKGHYLRNPDTEGPRLYRVKHNEMSLDMRNTKEVAWDSRLLVEPRVGGLRGLRFDLDNNASFLSRWDDRSFNPVEVLSVSDASGQPLDYRHRKDQLIVMLPRPTTAGEPLTIRVTGRAEVIYQITAESYGLMQVSWYPQEGFAAGRSSFRWTIRVPRPYLITGSGRVIRDFEDAETKQIGVELACDDRVSFPWIIFGRFQKAESTYTSEESGRTIPLSIHSFPTMTVPITDRETLDDLGLTTPITVSLTAPVKKVNGFFDEGKQILKLYEKIYGPYPYEALHIAQMGPFLGFGQAPQGFVQLTGEAFMSAAPVVRVGDAIMTLELGDFFHGFFAHEIAHQWWGHQIGGASRDDEWLSEAFAEYAAGIFVKEYQGAKRFQRKLEGWKSRAKISDGEAPIAAANTLFGVVGSRRHRNNLLYNKGPYVVHMLRIQLNDEKYMKVMRTLQATHTNRDISTEQLVSVINQVTGADYTYFFDQWFWDVGIPTFRYSWRAERRPDGKFLVSVHVSQEDKTRVKRVLMPVHVHFKEKSVPQYMPVVEAEQDLKIVVPERPKDVTLDDDHTLLADFVKAS